MQKAIANTRTFYIKQQICKTFGPEECDSILAIVSLESGFNPYSTNSNSGAIGLFQFYPPSKLQCVLSDIDCQIHQGFIYIKNRYGDANNAWAFWQNHNYY